MINIYKRLKMKKKLFQWGKPEDLQSIKRLLLENKLLLGVSDTIPGFLCVPSLVTYQKLNKIKGRVHKPYIVLAGSVGKAQALLEDPSPAMNALMAAAWPGPLTLIAPVNPEIPFYLSGGKQYIALRVPKHEGLLKLLEDIPYLFSTSANRAGEPAPSRLTAVEPMILEEVEALIDGDHDQIFEPSTILDCSHEPYRVIREGAYPVEKIEELLGYCVIRQKNIDS